MNSKQSISRLRDRWDEVNVSQIVRIFESGDLSGLGAHCGAHEGRVDLRGFPLQGSWGLGLVKGGLLDTLRRGKSASFSLSDIDFSHANVVSHTAIMCAGVTNCRFDYVESAKNGLSARLQFAELTADGCSFRELKAVGALGGTFKRCDFTKINLSGVEARYSTFANCVFADANLRKAKLGSSKFIECDFRNASCIGTEFSASTLDRCDCAGWTVKSIETGSDTAFIQMRNFDASAVRAAISEFSDPPAIK